MRTVAQVFPIRRSERALLVGKTGSGKSTLAKAILPQYDYLFVFDTKGGFDLPRQTIVTTPGELNQLDNENPYPVVYRPGPEHSNIRIHNAVLKWIYTRQNCTLYIDEVADLMDGPTVPEYYRHILKKGRALNIRTISGTQRPFRIPIDLLTETEHAFLFKLSMDDDKKRMREIMGPDIMKPLEHKFGFYYWNSDRDTVTEHILKGI